MERPKNYFWKEELVLKIFGISVTGGESIYYRIYSFIILKIFCTPYPFLAATDSILNGLRGTVDTVIYTIACSLGVTQITVLMQNRIRIGKLFEKLEKDPFIANEIRGGPGVETKLIVDCISFLTKQTNVYYLLAVIMAGPAGVVTLLKRLRSDDYHDWEFAYAPFTIINTTYSPNYEICWLYQYISVTAIASNSITTALITPGLLAHVSVQLKILQNFLRRIVPYSYKKCISENNQLTDHDGNFDPSKVQWKYLDASIKEVVIFHLDVTALVDEIISIFSMVMLTMYLAILCVMCLCVYEVSTHERFTVATLKTGTTAVIALTHIMLISYWGEQVVHESQQVSFAAYQANVPGVDTRFQKSLSFIIRRSQNSMSIKTGGFVDLSLVSFANIVRAAYSALMVLRKANNNSKNLD